MIAINSFGILYPISFILGFGLLIGGGNLLVNGAIALAKRCNLSPLLIGLVIVGFGTSVPELVTSLLAINQSASDLAVGNIIGSNIANILLILGIAAFILPIKVSKLSLRRDGKFLLLSAVILCCAAVFEQINFLMGVLMCGCLCYYVYYAYQTDKRHIELVQQLHEPTPQRHKRKKAVHRDVIFIIVGIGLTFFGARILVDTATMLALKAGVPSEIIGLTLIAIGTSLPELAASVIASIKKQPDVAFGNIVGSNIYNSLFILGFLAIFKKIPVQAGWNMLWMMLATTLLLFIAYTRQKLSKKTGILFLGLYAAYVFWLGIITLRG